VSLRNCADTVPAVRIALPAANRARRALRKSRPVRDCRDGFSDCGLTNSVFAAETFWQATDHLSSATRVTRFGNSSTAVRPSDSPPGWLMGILYLGITTGLEYETRWPAVQPGQCCFTVSRKRLPQCDRLWLGHEAKPGHRGRCSPAWPEAGSSTSSPVAHGFNRISRDSSSTRRRETPRGAIAGCYRP
jgi:hypothetical protein